MASIQHVTIDAAGRRLEANAERHLKSPRDMARLFRRAPEAIVETLRFVERCRFSLEELRKTEYPDERRPGFATPQEADFAKLCTAYGAEHVLVRDWAHFAELVSTLPASGGQIDLGGFGASFAVGGKSNIPVR